ncbi:hypothetical protein V8C44DRAFT_19439 [Trichoderma aethiopicum]
METEQPGRRGLRSKLLNITGENNGAWQALCPTRNVWRILCVSVANKAKRSNWVSRPGLRCRDKTLHEIRNGKDKNKQQNPERKREKKKKNRVTRARISCRRLVANGKAVDFLFFPLGNTNKMTDGPADKVPSRVAIVAEGQLLARGSELQQVEAEEKRPRKEERRRGNASSRTGRTKETSRRRQKERKGMAKEGTQSGIDWNEIPEKMSV